MTEQFDPTDAPVVALILLHGMLAGAALKPAMLEEAVTQYRIITLALGMADLFIQTAGEEP